MEGVIPIRVLEAPRSKGSMDRRCLFTPEQQTAALSPFVTWKVERTSTLILFSNTSLTKLSLRIYCRAFGLLIKVWCSFTSLIF